MIKLELNMICRVTGRHEPLLLVGDRFAISTRLVKIGGWEQDVTIIEDGINEGGWMVAEHYHQVKEAIENEENTIGHSR